MQYQGVAVLAQRNTGISFRHWEHRIRDDNDCKDIDYIHYNPVKHGYSSKPENWPYSSIHQYIKRGKLPKHWGCNENSVFGEA